MLLLRPLCSLPRGDDAPTLTHNTHPGTRQKRRLPEVDAVLLSHPDVAHAGALPALAASGRLRKGTPVYATLPVVKMATMALYDQHISRNVSVSVSFGFGFVWFGSSLAACVFACAFAR